MAMPPTIKVCVFGASGSGKTSAVRKYLNNEFDMDEEATVGVAYSAKIESVYGNKVRLDIWELSGLERFSIMAPMLWQGSHVIAIFYSVVDKDRSYERALIWIDQLKEAGCRSPIILVATKIDLPLSDHKVTSNIGKAVVQREGIAGYEEISSLSGQNLPHAFSLIAELGLRNVVYEDTNHLSPPEWVPDSCCTRCCQCNTLFTFSCRRHHCRSCGFLFCAACTPKTMPLPQFGFTKSVRVCTSCHKSST